MTEPLTPYQKKLFIFLSVATFFEGFDFLALTQVLPQLRAEFQLSESDAGWLMGAINVGTVLAYLLVRKADVWGRKRVLSITIAGYTVFTGLSALAPNHYVFGGLQLFARLFLIAEWATAMVFAAEEYPADRRGMVMGVIQAFSSWGSVACAGVVPLLLKTSLGWRGVYVVGVVPLLLLAVARRSINESRRFTRPTEKASPWRIWKTPYKKRLLQVSAIWSLTYLCTQNIVSWWKEFAVNERAWTDAQVGLTITIAAVSSMPFVFLAGKLLDVVGRRRGAVIIYSVAAVSCVMAFTSQAQWALTAGLAGGIFGASAVLPVLNAYSAELFPTEFRGDAFAWCNNAIGRIGYVAAPVVVGQLAGAYGVGNSVALTALSLLAALALIWWLLPETKNQELEATSEIVTASSVVSEDVKALTADSD